MIEPKCIFAPYPNGDTEDKERVLFRDFLVSKNGVMVFNTSVLERVKIELKPS